MYVDSDAEVAAARIGRTVGSRWRLERVLGIGGMAAVYQARDPNGTIAAVKILHPEMSARAEVRERFLREGYAANKIGHPGVVQAFEHGDRENDVFLAMELLEGETLRARVQRHGRLPLAEVLDYTDQILEVLVAAHGRGVVHRDLKPDNLFVTNHGRIKVLDFGLARLLDGVHGQHRTRTGVALGTLAYMAPEQALGRRGEIDGRVDIFALGATMFRVLSGRRVHEAESEAELLMAMASRPAPPLTSVATDVPPPLGAVVDLALAFSRDARYPDAGTMLADIRALRAGGAAPYASARLAARDEATRAEVPVPVQPVARTQPLEVVPASRPGTMPLSAYAPPSVPAPPPGFPPQEPPPISIRAPAPASQRTELAAGQGPNSLQGYAQPAAVAQAAYGAAVPSSTPVAGGGAPAKRSSLGLFLVLGGLMLVGIGGLLVAVLLAGSSGEVSTEVGPSRVSGAPVTSAGLPVTPPAVAAPAALAAEVQSPEAAPAQPADKRAGSGAAVLEPNPGPGNAQPANNEAKKAAVKPAATASAAAPPPAPSGAAAPTQSAAPAPAPAPSPVAPAPGPAPSPSVAPPPPPAPDAGQPSKKSGKGPGGKGPGGKRPDKK